MNEAVLFFGVTVLRATFGWLENALEDAKINLPEWRQYVTTLFRMSVPYLSLWLGFDVAPYEAAWMALLFDVGILKVAKLLDSLKKKK